jgi:hypothetical protein
MLRFVAVPIMYILPASTSRRRIRTEGRTKSIVPLTYYQILTVYLTLFISLAVTSVHTIEHF